MTQELFTKEQVADICFAALVLGIFIGVSLPILIDWISNKLCNWIEKKK